MVACGGNAADFGRCNPLVLDLGCGNGLFLSALAARETGWNCLGIEKKAYRVRQAQRRTASQPNARVLHGEIFDVLREMPEASIAAVYLLFSDPWPKRRHAVRRLVQEEFVSLLGERLREQGAFFFASDSPEYFGWARGLFSASSGWLVEDWVVPVDWPRTEFEQRFVSAGLNVWRFQATRKLTHE
jgi:tRNA (guanine-N7-)-methyltransferase